MSKLRTLAWVAMALAACAVRPSFAAGLGYYVEWIQSNGNQWIDTGVQATNGVASIVDVQPLNYDTVYYVTLLGGGSSGSDRIGTMSFQSNAYCFWYKNNRAGGPSMGCQRRSVVECELRAGYQKISANGTDYTKTYAGACGSKYNMYLFALNTAGGVSEKCTARLYSCKIYKVDETDETYPRTLVRDFRPCVDTDGVKCLYDEVSATCFYNKNTSSPFPSVGPRYNETTKKFDLVTVTASAGSHGSVSLSASDSGVAGLYRIGETVTVTATPADGYAHAGWTGLPESKRPQFLQTSVSFILEGPMTISNTFEADRFGRARTAPLRLHVAPTASGTGDGTSWANAQTDVREACITAGLCPAGGEVWIKGGVYRLSQTIPFYPNVKIVGSCRGDETEAPESDPETRRTILHADLFYGKSGAAVWKYRPLLQGAGQYATSVPVLDGSELVEPPVSDYGPCCTWQSSSNAGRPAFSRVDGCATNSLLAGVTMSLFGNSQVVCLKNAAVDGLVISNCTFWGAHNGGNGTIYAEYCPLTVCDSLFVAGIQAIRLYSPRKAVRADIRGCTFRHNDSWQIGGYVAAGAISLYGYVTPYVYNCTFDHNICNAQYYSPAPVFGALSAWSDVITGRFERCTFTRNVATNNQPVGMCYFATIDNSRFDFVDSKFVANTNYQGAGWSTAGCATQKGTHLVFRNCYFTKNCALDTSGGRNVGALVYSDSGFGNTIGFINCTAESNTTRSAGSGTAQCATLQNYRAAHFFVLNSVFRDNDNISASARGPEIRRGESWPYYGSIVIVNSILTHTAADYVPVEKLGVAHWGYGYSYVKNVGSPTANSQGFVYDLLTTEPALKPLKRKRGGSYGLQIKADDPNRGTSVLTWTGKDDFPYFYDTRKNAWRALRAYLQARVPAQTITDAEAAALGLSTSKPSDPDFRGVQRPRKPSPTPIDYGGGMYFYIE